MLKTNSKEVMNRIKKIIMDSYEAAEEYYTFEGATMKTEYNEICKDILNMTTKRSKQRGSIFILMI